MLAFRGIRFFFNNFSNNIFLASHGDYRRIRAKAGKQNAAVALARKLAVIYYRMINSKEAYNPQALIDYQNKYKEQKSDI